MPLKMFDYVEFLEDFGKRTESAGVRDFALRGERGAIVEEFEGESDMWYIVEVFGPKVDGWPKTVALVDVPARCLNKVDESAT